MDALFVYGTLLQPAVLRAVTGLERTPAPAVLDGFARRRLDGEVFPAIVPAVGDAVEGALYGGIDASAWRRLDAFEGELYERRRVTVRLRRSAAPPEASGEEESSDRLRAAAYGGAPRSVAAFAYVLREDWRHRLGSSPWDPGAFARDHLERFLERLRGSGS